MSAAWALQASADITSRYDGKIVALHYDVGDMAKTGTALVDIDVEDEEGLDDAEDDTAAAAPPASAAEPAAPAPAAMPTGHKLGADGKVLATPAVRRIAREHDVTLAEVRSASVIVCCPQQPGVALVVHFVTTTTTTTGSWNWQGWAHFEERHFDVHQGRWRVSCSVPGCATGSCSDTRLSSAAHSSAKVGRCRGRCGASARLAACHGELDERRMVRATLWVQRRGCHGCASRSEGNRKPCPVQQEPHVRVC